MHAPLRVLPLALVAIGAVTPVAAQSPELPPIFAPGRLESFPPPVVEAARKPAPLVSDRLRQAITEKILADTTPFEASAGSGMRVIAWAFDAPVLMDQFLVRSEPVRRRELPSADSPFIRFLKTGTLYRKVTGKTETEIFLRLLPTQTRRGSAAGIEIGFSFSW
jgi:hypothetical protein